MSELNDTRSRRSGGGSGWEELDLRFDSLRQLETDFVQYLATDGLFVPTADPLAPSSVVRLRLLLPDDFVLLEGTGVVFWVREADVSGPAGLPPGMAIRFAALGQQHQDMVDRLIRSLEERGGRPFDLDQAVAAADAPAPSAKRSRKPEVARLQVRGEDRPSAVVTAPGEQDTGDGVPWAERTISLGVPPIEVPEAGEAIAEAPGPAPDPADPSSEGGPSVDATLELAWARAEAALASAGHGKPDPSDSEVAAPAAWIEDEWAGGEPALPPAGVVVEAMTGETPSESGRGRDPEPSHGPTPRPVVMPDAEAESTEDLAPEEELEGAARGPRGLIGLAVGLAVVAVVAVGVLRVDPLGWRAGGGTVGQVTEAVAPAVGGSDVPLPAADGMDRSTSTDAGSEQITPAGVDAEAAEEPVAQELVAAVEDEAAPEPAPAAARAGRVVDIGWMSGDGTTEVTVTGDGRLDERLVAVQPLSGPPRILVRLTGIEEGYGLYTLEVGTPELLRIRTGHHPELSPPALFVVLDTADASVAVLGAEISGTTVRVTVGRRPR